ncbi:MAG: right-handed parallel beta-helix repeat-containing protein, partial [Armatimonadota bacterium]|nr:right-handed parallel beta-helix repeat-containing protein [Armatimonadota bacterium]
MERRSLCRILLLSVCILLVLSASASASIIRVKWNSPANGPGDSWDNAYQTVQAAINAASAGDEIWVAAGTYVERITLKKDVALYGGFSGVETERDQRNWVANVTILDGNQGGSVVTASNLGTTTARIDGFTIRNGSASNGGGIYCSNSSPIISNNTITANSASNYGGGIYCYSSSSPIIVNNTIATNSATYGGGIHCYSSSPIISNNSIRSNSAAGGGSGIYCSSSSPTISNNVITSNSITSGSSVPEGGGGIACYSSSPVIANNIIAANTAYGGSSSGGGGIYCYSSSPIISNNTLIANIVRGSSTTNGGGIYCIGSSSSPAISNNIIAFNSSGIYNSSGSPTLRNNCVYNPGSYNYSGVSAGTGDIQVDPKLCYLEYGNFHIKTDSPCIDAGDSSVVQPGWVDIDGQARIQGVSVDIGADESDGTACEEIVPVIVRVSTSGNDSNDGLSWSSAKRSVQSAIEAVYAAGGGEVWVATGTYVERIELRSFVHVYGGFAGTEVSREQRNWVANVTILDGNQGGSVVKASNIGATTARIDGFTIRNGKATYDSGGGILCSYSSPIISNNTIIANNASYGGGICCSSSSPIIYNNAIVGNSSSASSSSYGGGIYCSSSSSPTIYNNTIVGNSATYGGGIYCASPSSAIISNNIVAFNSSGIYNSSGSPTLRNNCVYNPNGYNYSGVSPGTGDIQVDPKLCSLEYGNFHIKLDSPCIDAGDSSVVQPGWVDIDGQARIQGVSVDIGADESDGTACEVEPVIVRVSPSGNDSNDGSSWSSAKRSVQSAIDAVYAAGGGEVWVAAGTYVERITLRSFVHVYGGFAGTETLREQRNWVANATILDGNQGGSVVTVSNIGANTARIDGFTIRNGNAANGGGIYCSSASPIISNNMITANSASTYGGGIYCNHSSPIISSNTITANSTGRYGGGIYCFYSSPVISNNTITTNSAPGGDGGGILCSYSSPTISNNTIVGNSASNGSGIYCSGSSAIVLNNTIAENTASTAGGGIFCISSPSPIIANNVIAANTACGSSSSGGGGIYCYSSSIISNNTIIGNSASPNGGGIYCTGSSSTPAISNNIIAFNTSGIYRSSGSPTLRNNCVYNPNGYNYSGVSPGT